MVQNNPFSGSFYGSPIQEVHKVSPFQLLWKWGHAKPNRSTAKGWRKVASKDVNHTVPSPNLLCALIHLAGKRGIPRTREYKMARPITSETGHWQQLRDHTCSQPSRQALWWKEGKAVTGSHERMWMVCSNKSLGWLGCDTLRLRTLQGASLEEQELSGVFPRCARGRFWEALGVLWGSQMSRQDLHLKCYILQHRAPNSSFSMLWLSCEQHIYNKIFLYVWKELMGNVNIWNILWFMCF